MRRFLIVFALAAFCVPALAGNVCGRVTCEGAPLAGVAVSDGVSIVLTDASGRYCIDSDKRDGSVFVITPSGYVARSIDGLRPGFWQPLHLAAELEEVHDFVLEKQDQSRYTVVLLADMHLSNDPARDDLNRFRNEVLPVIRKQVSAAEGAAYSFNLGDLHFLMIDNMLAQDGAYSDECATGLTDDIWTFVQNDLKLVPSSASIMICAHSPMFRLLAGNDRKGPHLSELKSLLGRFKRVYAWAGHTHATFNYYDKNSNVEVHTLGRVTGALWTNEFLCENGTPRGYMVFDYDAGSISWKFKPIFWQTAKHSRAGTDKEPGYEYRDWDYDASGRAMLKSGGQLTDKYQMQVFKPGTYDANDKTIYVNIFLWDEAWKTPTFQMEGSATPSVMERVTESNGKLYRYSYADWDISAFYVSKWPWFGTQWYDNEGADPSNKKQNCTSIFRYTLNTTDAHGSGTVKVKDRFGKEHTSTITW